MTLDELQSGSNERLLSMIPTEQFERVMAAEMCDIDPEFLGFVGIYERLSQMIPEHWTVVDLGCAYAPQAFFFEKHKAYIGVDLMTPISARFFGRNTTHHTTPISQFIKEFGGTFDLGQTFAICSYVPPWHDDNGKLAREFFQNVFVYYPCGGYDPVVKCPS